MIIVKYDNHHITKGNIFQRKQTESALNGIQTQAPPDTDQVLLNKLRRDS